GFGLLIVDARDVHDAAAQFQRSLHRVGDSAALTTANDDAVHDDFHRVLAAVGGAWRLLPPLRCFIHTHADEAITAHFIEQGFVLFLPAPLQRGHQIELRAFGEGLYLVDDFIGRLRADGDAAR